MLILGLGSNTGNRLNHLRQARQLLNRIPQLTLVRTSPLYLSDALLPEQAPSSWNQPFLNLAILCNTTLPPQGLLQHIKNVEYALGRQQQKQQWAPRIIDIDILAWDDLIIEDTTLHIPHAGLLKRPFALWPLADLTPEWIYPEAGPFQGKTAAELCSTWGSRFSGESPQHTKQIPHRIDTPQLVGILNITPDSFSDGGQFSTLQNAVHQAYHLASSGAEIIDIGAEATNPHVMPLHAEDEWDRLEPVLSAIKKELPYMFIPPQISIDTRHADVAEKAMRMGIDWINDPSGLTDPKMREMIAASKSKCVVMHNLSIPADKNHVLSFQENPVTFIHQWGEKCIADLEKSGIAREKIIFDVGIGFGKHAEHSFALLKNIRSFFSLKIPLLVGHSRKSFLSLFTNKSADKRDLETTIISIYLAKQGVDYLRIHNVEACSQGIKMAMFL